MGSGDHARVDIGDNEQALSSVVKDRRLLKRSHSRCTVVPLATMMVRKALGPPTLWDFASYGHQLLHFSL